MDVYQFNIKYAINIKIRFKLYVGNKVSKKST